MSQRQDYPRTRKTGSVHHVWMMFPPRSLGSSRRASIEGKHKRGKKAKHIEIKVPRLRDAHKCLICCRCLKLHTLRNTCVSNRCFPAPHQPPMQQTNEVLTFQCTNAWSIIIALFSMTSLVTLLVTTLLVPCDRSSQLPGASSHRTR